MHFLGTDRAGLYATTHGMDTSTARLYGRALCQRCSGTPLQYLTGEQSFMDLALVVSPGVFVPRPETEGLVEAALEAITAVVTPVIVDVGTGTGAVALAIKRHRPDARVLATDVSEAAVTLATQNAARHGLDVEVHQGDLLSTLPAKRGRLDLLVSNPPYVAREEYETLPEEVRAEPYEALVGGTEVHQRLVELAPVWLVPGGWLVVEIGADQGALGQALFAARLDPVGGVLGLAGGDAGGRGR